jgi:putative FmdB family regulatory protein
MPWYDYRCPKCGVVEELRLPMGHLKPLCAECGATMVMVYHPVLIPPSRVQE